MTIVTLVRHGQTEWNLLRRVQGSTDIPLNDTGRTQAREAGIALADGGYARVVTSPLSRARQTASIIAATLGLPEPAPYDGLRERGYGEAEGMSVDDYHAQFPLSPAPGGETPDAVRDRALRAVEQIVTDAAATGADGEPVIAVAHGGVIRYLLESATDGALPRPGDRVENGSRQIFAFESGALTLVSYTPVNV